MRAEISIVGLEPITTASALKSRMAASSTVTLWRTFSVVKGCRTPLPWSSAMSCFASASVMMGSRRCTGSRALSSNPRYLGEYIWKRTLCPRSWTTRAISMPRVVSPILKLSGEKRIRLIVFSSGGAYTCLSGIYASYISSVKRSLSNPPTASGKTQAPFSDRANRSYFFRRTRPIAPIWSA